MPEPVVFVVDDEEPVRSGLESMLTTRGFKVRTCKNSKAFLQAYDPGQPGCAILDIRMPGMNGLELQQYLLQNRILLPVIILTGHGDVPMAVEAMESGAVSFLEKPAAPDVLIAKVRQGIERDAETRRNLMERDEVVEHLNTLTPREREVAELLIQGKSARAVAAVLGTSESTVRVQRANIRRKMQAESTTDLLRMFLLVNEIPA